MRAQFLELGLLARRWLGHSVRDTANGSEQQYREQDCEALHAAKRMPLETGNWNVNMLRFREDAGEF